MEIDFNRKLLTLACCMFAIFTIKHFSFKQKLLKRDIVIRHKNRYTNTQELLIIASDTQRKLYDGIMKKGPYRYVSEEYGIFLIFQSIEIIGDDIDYEDTFLIKIARFMNVPTDNIHSKEDLIKLIDNHITYNPNTTINGDYGDAKSRFGRISYNEV